MWFAALGRSVTRAALYDEHEREIKPMTLANMRERGDGSPTHLLRPGGNERNAAPG